MTKSVMRHGFLAMLFLLLSFGLTNAQEYRGTITGTITDPSGAVVPAATVTVQNVETNVSATATTNDEGAYTFPLLIPGKYKVTATATNFKTSVRENVQLNVGDRLTTDFQLEIGTTTEVNVVADTEVIERGNVETGTLITERQITELPLPEGAAYSLATQAPGVVYTGNPMNSGPTANGGLASFRSNGVNSNQITLDGSPNSIFDGGVAYTPPADAVSQFKIQTSAFDAQNGYTAGATVNVAVKNGTNKFHGSGYFFERPKIFTANNFFNNRQGNERADRLYYRYGGQVNGPVRVPYIYNGKDKTFFMFSYEKQYNRQAFPQLYSVPTVKMRSGDFSELLSQSTPTLIYDPATGVLRNTSCAAGSTGTTVCRTPFAGNIIPQNRFTPGAQAYLNLFPLPNNPGIVNNYFSNTTGINEYNTYLTRIDHNFNDTNKIFGKFFYSKGSDDKNNFTELADSFARGVEYRTNKGGSLNFTSTLSSTLILDIRGGYNDFLQHREPTNPITAADLGFAGIDAITDSTVLPRFNFQNYITFGPARSDYNEGLDRDFSEFSFQPTLTQIYGNHTFKYGYDYRRLMETRESNNNNAGLFTFGGTYTAPASNSGTTPNNLPGRELAAFLLGLPISGSIDTTPSKYDVKLNYNGLFIQDDWRVTSNLTLNLGLRYEQETGLKEANNQIVGFDATSPNPLRAQVLANYNALPPLGVPIDAFQNLSGGLLYFNGGNNQSTDTNNWQPRFGLSYALNDKTVIRAGIGVFTSPFQIQAINQTGFTATTQFPATTNSGLTFPATLANPFPNGFQAAIGSSQGLATSLGTSFGSIGASGTSSSTIAGPSSGQLFPYERKNANYTRFILGFQRQLPWKVGFEVNYVYSRGSDLQVLRQLNFVPRQYLNNFAGVTDPATILNSITSVTDFLAVTVNNPFRGLVPNVNTYNANTITRRLLLTGVPQFQELVVAEYNGSSDYQSLQLQATKRISRGFSFNTSYTYARDYETTRRLNPQDENLTRTVSPFSRPHRFTFSGIYELPFGKGRWIGNEWNGFVNALFGGWQLQAVYERQSGEPIVFPNLYYNGDITQLENKLGQRDDQGRRYGLDIPAFDTAGFYIIDPRPTIGGVANANFNKPVAPGVGNNFSLTGQNTLRSIPYTMNNFRNTPFQKFDAGLTKNFRFKESMNLQVRVEAINALNWVYFYNMGITPSSTSAFGFATEQRNLPRDIQIAARFTF